MIPSMNDKPFPDSFPKSPAASSYSNGAGRGEHSDVARNRGHRICLTVMSARGAEMALWSSR